MQPLTQTVVFSLLPLARHSYTLQLNPDGTYVISFDNKEKASGKIEDGWAFPKKEIKDPDTSKPDDWVDVKKIPDPEADKPDGYDDIPAEIPDPEAEQPEDWDEEEDGEWEAPMIDNPEFKGEWKPAMVDNPAYKGEWVHPMVANAEYKPDTYAKFPSLTTIGFELWVVNKGSIFDNILVTDDAEYAKSMGEKTFAKITDGEKVCSHCVLVVSRRRRSWSLVSRVFSGPLLTLAPPVAPRSASPRTRRTRTRRRMSRRRRRRTTRTPRRSRTTSSKPIQRAM